MQPDQLKAYEREIVRARARVEVADLDNEIDRLIVLLVGKLTRKEYEIYQSARLEPFLATPELIVAHRAMLLGVLHIKKIAAPDILTREELASLVVIMQAIATWLQQCADTGSDVSFAQLAARARSEARDALAQFEVTYGSPPKLDDVPSRLMTITRAKSLVKLAGNSIVPLSAPEDDV